MKEVRETKLVEKTTVKYVADDGKEFVFESECKAYEASKNKERVEYEYRKIHLGSFSPPLVEWYYGESAGCDIVYLKDEKDFDVMTDYFYMKGKCINDIAENRNSIKYPRIEMVTFGEEWLLFAPMSIEELEKMYISASKILRMYLNNGNNNE